MASSSEQYGHDYGDIPIVNLSEATYTDTPTITDGTPATQPDTGRQPRVSASRFTYPNPGPGGRLAD